MFVITKNLTNVQLAELLRAVASAYEIKNADQNKFKIIAYQRAADAVEHLSSEAKDLWDEGKLADIPGIGTSISRHLDEIFKSGKSKHFSKLMAKIPTGVFELIELPGIGAKTAVKLIRELKLESVQNVLAEVEKAAQAGKIAAIPGFGAESQADILRAIQEDRRKIKRYLLPYASSLAREIIQWLKQFPEVIAAEALGSLRRRAATIGDLDIAVATNRPQKVLQHFTDYPRASRVIEKGSKTASILLPGDIQVDLMIQQPDSFGSLLQHFTGSKHHNIALREYALKQGLSLSEYGIKQVNIKNSKLRTFATEKDFYNYLNLDYIEPELREDAGEIEAAVQGQLPHLVQLSQIKGDLQIHSNFDIETSHDLGQSTMEQVIQKANSLGYEYLAFTEHNPSRSQHTEVEVVDILKRKREAIEKINYSLVKNRNNRVKKVYNSLEIDILPTGQLAVPEKALELLDFALVSVHSAFRQQRKEASKRILSALSSPRVKIFAHPTGRKLNEREGVEYDWPEIFAFCKDKDVWLEINADPMRLDLPDFLVREAIKMGIKLTIGTDAHHQAGLDNMQWGIDVARRGWATANDIVNTRNLVEFDKMLR